MGAAGHESLGLCRTGWRRRCQSLAAARWCPSRRHASLSPPAQLVSKPGSTVLLRRRVLTGFLGKHEHACIRPSLHADSLRDCTCQRSGNKANALYYLYSWTCERMGTSPLCMSFPTQQVLGRTSCCWQYIPTRIAHRPKLNGRLPLANKIQMLAFGSAKMGASTGPTKALSLSTSTT